MKNGQLVFILILSFGIESCRLDGKVGRQKNFNEQLGTYKLDIQKTDLENYRKDSKIYKNLLIVFKSDSTFEMNMKVPFMFDNTGTWEAGDMKGWNSLKYGSFKYPLHGTGEQFTRPEYPDSTFLLNSSTPQVGAEFIEEIYFKKMTNGIIHK
jgi:hypothetical protein